MNSSAEKPVANALARYDVTDADLPLCCPNPKFRIWDSHPRVYLPIEKTGREACPYCGIEYVLVTKPAS